MLPTLGTEYVSLWQIPLRIQEDSTPLVGVIASRSLRRRGPGHAAWWSFRYRSEPEGG